MTAKFRVQEDLLADQIEEGVTSPLPSQRGDEFRPFVRRLPEWQFWCDFPFPHMTAEVDYDCYVVRRLSTTRATVISFLMTFSAVFDVPVYWPILVMYFCVLFVLTMRRQLQSVRPFYLRSVRNHFTQTHDQIPLCSLLLWQGQIRQQIVSFNETTGSCESRWMGLWKDTGEMYSIERICFATRFGFTMRMSPSYNFLINDDSVLLRWTAPAATNRFACSNQRGL